MDIFIKGDGGNSNVDVNFTDSGGVHAAPGMAQSQPLDLNERGKFFKLGLI